LTFQEQKEVISETNSRTGISEICMEAPVTLKGYQPRTDIVKCEKGDRIADTHDVVGRWRNHISQLLNVHGLNDVRQTEIYTAKPLVPKPSVIEFEIGY